MDLRFKRFAIQLLWDPNDFVTLDLRFKRFGCQLIRVEVLWLSIIDLGFKWFEIQAHDLRFKWCVRFKSFQVQMIPDAIASGFKWCESHSIWDSVGWQVVQFEIQLVWDSIDLRFSWCEIPWVWNSKSEAWKFKSHASFEVQYWSYLLHTWSFDAHKTKLLCETSFKNEALKLKNEAFVRDFLQKWSFEGQKLSFCVRLPSKMKLWSSKTKLLSFCARLPSKMTCWPDTWPQNYNTF